MTTIDSYDNEWYRKHARTVRDLETTYKDLRVSNLEEARAIQPHTWVESLENHIPMVDLLMGTYGPERKTIAFFTRPFMSQRKSPFGFFLLAPSLGPYEKQMADAERLYEMPVFWENDEDEEDQDSEEEKERKQGKNRLEKKRKNAVEKMYGVLNTLNTWLLEIKGKQSQYQKG